MSRRRLALLSAVAAAVLATGLIVPLALRDGSKPAAAPSGVARVSALLAGLPQSGTALGTAGAPVTVYEFADLQCPFCAQWAQLELPGIVQRYVRPGKVRLVFSGMSFLGPDSETALRTALAAASQGRFWQVLELLFENQGRENAGWVTESLLRSIGAAVPGLDAEKMLADRSSAAVDTALVQAAARAQQMGINSTPSFAVGATGGAFTVVDASGVDSAVAAALKQ